MSIHLNYTYYQVSVVGNLTISASRRTAQLSGWRRSGRLSKGGHPTLH
ncbi:MAG: hypothetical protein Q4C55_06270 [Eubacterium sp.]|nr:hypothetical protein [Eubacterium sp.]